MTDAPRTFEASPIRTGAVEVAGDVDPTLVDYIRIARMAEIRKGDSCPDCGRKISQHARVHENATYNLGCGNTQTHIVRVLDGISADDYLNETVSDFVCYYALHAMIEKNIP